MRYSKLFGKTRKTVAKDADSRNAGLLTQAGFIHKVGAGIYEFLPLGNRVLKKINQVIREEMEAIDSQEVVMPMLHPINYWESTGRDKSMAQILFRSKGFGNSDFVFGPSHEEIITPLVQSYVQSYKDLPLCLYQIQSKFRNEPRPKSGLLRGREFGMKDMYSFHATKEDLEDYYEKSKPAYLNVFSRLGLDAKVVEAGGGAFTESFTHEFSVFCENGEDTILYCEDCKYGQNIEIANVFHQPLNPDEEEGELTSLKVERDADVEASAKAHAVEHWKVLKTVVFKLATENFIGVCIRGDLQVNKDKLSKILDSTVRTATAEELEQLGLTQGYISPVSNDKIEFIGDYSVTTVKNFCTGANEKNVDYVNVNLGRDFVLKELLNLATLDDNVTCSKCKSKNVNEFKAVEVGNIFKLGTKFSDAFDFKFADESGALKPVIMGCYGIGTTRLMGVIAEICNDEKGLLWPKGATPYHVHLIALGDGEVTEFADEVYKELSLLGFDVLYDDRNESAGFKFNDADLIGIPVRIVVSKKLLADKNLEIKYRTSSDAKLLDLQQVVKELKDFYA